MARGSKKLIRFVDEIGLEVEVVSLAESTRTSRMAAEALSCSVAQIAKSIVLNGDSPVVAVISGDMKVDLKKLSDILGFEVKIADAEFVRSSTGYVIGGVPPFPHDDGVIVLLDMSLQRFEEVWTAAGTPYSVMKIRVDAIQDIVGGEFVDFSKQAH